MIITIIKILWNGNLYSGDMMSVRLNMNPNTIL